MSIKTSLVISAVLILIVILAGVFLWSRLPDPMASHWNEMDQVDGYMSRFWGVFMLPLMMIGITLLFWAIPSIDPLKKNIAEFRGWFNLIIVFFNLFMAFVHGLTLAWNLGLTGFSMGTAMVPAIGILFILMGLMVRKAKRNYFIGIRTPWTLASDSVWLKTHRLGGILFIASGLICFLGIFFPGKAFLLLIVPVLVFSVFLVIYSYIIFRKEETKSS